MESHLCLLLERLMMFTCFVLSRLFCCGVGCNVLWVWFCSSAFDVGGVRPPLKHLTVDRDAAPSAIVHPRRDVDHLCTVIFALFFIF